LLLERLVADFLRDVDLFALDFRAVDLFAVDLFAVDLFAPALFVLERLRGTLAPLARASDKPIAMACLRDVTLG
jgi:hypothetical protein